MLLDKGLPKYTRLSKILSSANPVSPPMRFNEVLDHLGLSEVEGYEELYGLWSGVRNPLSHRMSDSDESEEAWKKNVDAESRIAGAINCLVLKLMDYSGWVRLSAFENKYGKI
jgi:hypothetical protein